MDNIDNQGDANLPTRSEAVAAAIKSVRQTANAVAEAVRAVTPDPDVRHYLPGAARKTLDAIGDKAAKLTLDAITLAGALEIFIEMWGEELDGLD